MPVDVALALARLGTGDAAGAIVLLRDLLRRYDFREGWTALAAAHLARGEPDAAAQALARALARHAPDPATTPIMDRIASAAMWPGWCGLSGEGRLLIDGADGFAQADLAQGGHAQSGHTQGNLVQGGRYDIRLDGAALHGGLPRRWRQGCLLEVRCRGAPLLGSPLDVRSILRSEGFVEAEGGALSGWLWHPGEPERTPGLLVLGEDGSRRRLRLAAFAERIDSDIPLARPRRLFLPASELPPGPVRLLAEDGRALTGSPLDPGLLLRLSRRRGAARTSRRTAAVAARPASAAFDVVIPVFRHLRRTLDCIDSVRATIPATSRIVVVDDASPEPALSEALQRLAAQRAVVLIRHAINRGFPASANAGIAACGRRDALLLNSDTLVAGDWTAALREAVYASPDIGTATPLSNDASILSYPEHRAGNPVPDLAETRRLMGFARAANRGRGAIDIPTGHGFCWYLRRDCLDQAGMLREDLFAQGYGEENEFCLRAGALGWRHVGVPDAFVGHVGQVSFAAARRALMARNLAILERLHPGYGAMIEAHIASDPLAPARRRIDRLRFEAGRAARPRAVLLITHDEAGGVERVVRARARALAAEGIRPIVLRPRGGACSVDVPMPGDLPLAGDAPLAGDPLAAEGSDAPRRQFPNLCYVLPREMDDLLALLGGEGLLHAEWHHLLGHHPALRTLCGRLGIPYDVHLHDYAWFCARIALLGPSGRYCGEPDVAGCEACVAVQGSNLGEAITPAALRQRSAVELAEARRVLAPSQDAARRIARHFPAIRPAVVPLEDDAPALPLARFADATPAPPALLAPEPARVRICVVGGIGMEKGYAILLACLLDARARGLALDFVVVGHTPDDEALLEAGCLDVTGAYHEAEAVTLVRAQRCDLAFLPSIWPETWCFTLGVAWRAGLAVAAFDIGAQAERIRRTGRGAVLPLGLPVAAVNDALRRLAELGGGPGLAPAAGPAHPGAPRGDGVPSRMLS